MGRVFDAEEAKQLGLVQRVFPKQQLTEVLNYASDMAKNCPPSGMAVIKQQILKHQHVDGETALRESNRLLMFGTSPDMKEGMRSFVEKRQPKFAPYDPDTDRQKLKDELFSERRENAALKEALQKLRSALGTSKL